MTTGGDTPRLGPAIPVLGPVVLHPGAGTPQDAGTPGEGGGILVPVRVHKAPQMAANVGRERSWPRGWRWWS
ncbi:hypothetical protein NicSoilC5_20680 [Arthrobacter sp. NicSoilC5]|nr:hypothetical protein NicSoilC5_20680 [Arthrobacter sp. NicSoilC5]